MPKLTRRDFLKLTSMASGAFAFSRLTPKLQVANTSQGTSLPNILIFVFDAMSAENLSLYNYHRETTPNFKRFAEHATVFNSHYSAATFTTPGTASLLTGLYPWTHRAINETGLIKQDLVRQNLFRSIGQYFYRLAFSQNMWANYFFAQFQQDIQKILSPASFSMVSQVLGDKFGKDLLDSYRALDDFLFQDGTPPASLVLGVTEKYLLRRALVKAQSADYPRGIPRAGNYPIFFQLKDVFDGVRTTIEELSSPSLAYLHLWSPHDPYRPTAKFDKFFIDGWAPKPKPDHTLGDHLPTRQLNGRRQAYDKYIANVDFEFGKLIDFLDSSGLLDKSYIIVTSDHGNMFERGVIGHVSPLLNEPVVRIPLMISSPGQTSRKDVYAPTVSVDVVPTLAHLIGNEIPAWAEGELLPQLGGHATPGRSVFMMDAKSNPAFAPLKIASFAVRKDQYKLIYYKGYQQYNYKDAFELYDVENDPEELNDLYSDNPSIAKPLQDELLAKVNSVNAKYEH